MKNIILIAILSVCFVNIQSDNLLKVITKDKELYVAPIHLKDFKLMKIVLADPEAKEIELNDIKAKTFRDLLLIAEAYSQDKKNKKQEGFSTNSLDTALRRTLKMRYWFSKDIDESVPDLEAAKELILGATYLGAPDKISQGFAKLLANELHKNKNKLDEYKKVFPRPVLTLVRRSYMDQYNEDPFK